MAVIISIYGINFGVGTKFGPKFNKEVTFLSTVLPVRFNTAVFITVRLLFKTICECFWFSTTRTYQNHQMRKHNERVKKKVTDSYSK